MQKFPSLRANELWNIIFNRQMIDKSEKDFAR